MLAGTTSTIQLLDHKSLLFGQPRFFYPFLLRPTDCVCMRVYVYCILHVIIFSTGHNVFIDVGKNVFAYLRMNNDFKDAFVCVCLCECVCYYMCTLYVLIHS